MAPGNSCPMKHLSGGLPPLKGINYISCAPVPSSILIPLILKLLSISRGDFCASRKSNDANPHRNLHCLTKRKNRGFNPKRCSKEHRPAPTDRLSVSRAENDKLLLTQITGNSCGFFAVFFFFHLSFIKMPV